MGQPQMDFDAVLEKCGNFGRFQYLILLCFAITNILSSLHYFSQTIISFTPEHWCYHEKSANASFDEIRAVYAQTKSPHASRRYSRRPANSFGSRSVQAMDLQI